MQGPPQRSGPLAGLKVLEIGHYIAAPFCTRILADLGAEVIKVEPPGGDPFRGWGASVDGNSVWFSVHGRNKLSVVLDLKRDRDTLLKLAARADVILSICPPHAAREVAGSVAGFQGIYVDANAIAPATAREVLSPFRRGVDGGIVGGRWVKDQEAHIVRLADGVFRLSWVEPTGTGVSLAVNLPERRLHGTIFFPRWVVEAPEKIAVFQNPVIEQMLAYRDAGPSYPIEVVDSFAEITFVEDCASGDETVIACGPEALPAGYASRRN